MMKCKVTKKAVKNSYNKIIGIGYCSAQYLLRYQNAFGYNAGTYGWNCDFYDVNGVCISTGYNHIGNVNVKCPYKLIERFEGYARSVAESNKPYEEKKKLTNYILEYFIREASTI